MTFHTPTAASAADSTATIDRTLRGLKRRGFEIVRPHRQVKAIFYGHSHVWELDHRQHLQLINLPAIGYNFRDQDPVGWVDARFHRQGVDLTLHAFGSVTETAIV